jgi:predicted NAD/FAD-dependent oxidoreductase
MPEIAIIGAGISGLACARKLQEHGHSVSLFDKGRHPGGRVATRTANYLTKSITEPINFDNFDNFDHGAQFFTARSDVFRKHLQNWINQGVVSTWEGRLANLDATNTSTDFRASLQFNTDDIESIDRYVGVPSMRALCEHLARGLLVTQKALIERINYLEPGWSLECAAGSTQKTRYDALVLSLPPKQTADLLLRSNDNEILQERCRKIDMAPCWAMLCKFQKRLPIDYDGIFVKNSLISWLARDSSKPGRIKNECWVIHASPNWSELHLEEDSTLLGELLLEEFFRLTGVAPVLPVLQICHRWRYALPRERLVSTESFVSTQPGLYLCGDWLKAPRIEGAFLSGLETAERIICDFT